MARVSIEERAAAAAKKLARRMKWSRSEALGSLYFFWHDSQELEQTHCTASDICLWMDVDDADEASLIDGMIEAAFIEPAREGVYLICGNEKHIKNIRQRREAAKENGKLGGRPRKPEITNVGLEKKPTSVILETHVGFEDKPTRLTETNPADNHSSLQFSALQFSAIQKREKTAFSIQALVELWQKERGILPAMISTRIPAARADMALKAVDRAPDPSHWRQVIARMLESDYLTGRNGKRAPAGFDFMIEHDIEILEGKYANAANATADLDASRWK